MKLPCITTLFSLLSECYMYSFVYVQLLLPTSHTTVVPGFWFYFQSNKSNLQSLVQRPDQHQQYRHLAHHQLPQLHSSPWQGPSCQLQHAIADKEERIH